MSARLEYAPGEAWCIAAERVVLVCERDLAPERAAALHAEIATVDTVEALRALLDAEPAALTGLIDLADRRVLLRRNGVPASAGDAPLIDRYGPDWASDETDAEDTVEAGGLGSLAAGTLPLEGGVVQVAAVRVMPRRAQASAAADAAVDAESARARSGAFGQTLPPAASAAAPAPEATTTADAPEPRPAAALEPRESTETGNPIGGLIDSVPGFIRPAVDLHSVPAPEPTAAAPTAPEPTAAAPTAPVPTAAVPTATAAVPVPEIGGDGDHDGMTVTAEQARALLEQQQQPQAVVPPATGPLVLSTLCPVGHVNAPGSLRCHLCGEQIDEGSAAQRRRPEVAVAVLGSGERIPLGRGVVVGRRPRSRRVEDGRVPRLVTVESPGEDVSRSHLELRVEDWNLVAIDLSSTNGTLLLREGAAPQRLRPEASTILQLGDRLDLGDGVVITIESAP